MPQANSSTDSRLSLASGEFLWDTGAVSEAHGYLAGPMVRLLRRHGAKIVLDLGCGNGALSAVMQAEGFGVTGCDYSSSGITLARAAFPQIAFFRHDLAAPLPAEHHGRYDAVVCMEVIEHLLLPRTLLHNAHAALRPGGLLVVSTPYHRYLKNLALALTNRFDQHWHPLRDFGHVKFFSKRNLLALLNESGFTVTDFVRVGRIPALAKSMIAAATKP
jgi:2-polyprenyl-3-methyl-5-hydroxy-6-metoxy-1,4-benzoquinol methylase